MAERGNVSVARLFRGGDVRWQQKAPRLKTRATSDGASCRGTACGARPKVENGSLSTEVSGTMTKELIRMKVNGELREIAAPAEKALLDHNPNPTLEEIRLALSSNLCRCTGYMQIYESVKLAIERAQAREAAKTAPVGS